MKVHVPELSRRSFTIDLYRYDVFVTIAQRYFTKVYYLRDTLDNVYKIEYRILEDK